MANAYILNSYWNPDWISKISNPNVQPLEHSLWNVNHPSNPTLEQLPGISPASPGAPGFQTDDTIRFGFQMAGGNTSNPPQTCLSSATIKFKKKGGIPQGELGNPLGITGGSVANGIFSLSCSSFNESDLGLPTYSQAFMADNTDTFKFTGEDSTWVLAVEALYTKPDGTIMTFAFDPEWKVGGGS